MNRTWGDKEYDPLYGTCWRHRSGNYLLVEVNRCPDQKWELAQLPGGRTLDSYHCFFPRTRKDPPFTWANKIIKAKEGV